VLNFGPFRKSVVALSLNRPRTLAVLCGVALGSLVAGLATARFMSTPHLPWASLKALPAHLLLHSPKHASERTSVLSPKADPDDVTRLDPQHQAERLLARAIAGSEPALEQIGIYSASWCGRVQETPGLFGLVRRALASDDLRVRNAAIETDLAANGLRKTATSVDRIAKELRAPHADRTWNLWRLGALGNRGVEPGTVLAALLHYVRDRDETTRFWAVEGLAAFGTDATIDPLLEVLRSDPSLKVRKSAALNLAESGMLTQSQRLAVIPDLLNFLDDDSLDTTTRGLVYATLRGITGEALGNDANAWREWWATHDRPRRSSADRSLVRA
jgi:hypothetical protein